MTSPRLLAASRSTRTEAEVRARRAGDAPPLTLRDLGSASDWLGDIASMLGLVAILAILFVFAGALIDTPDERQQSSITTNHNGE